MPHLTVTIPAEWVLKNEFREVTNFEPEQILDTLIESVSTYKMPNPTPGGDKPDAVPFINKSNLKHRILLAFSAGVAGDKTKTFIHVDMAAGNDTPGRTADVRVKLAKRLGDAVDELMAPYVERLHIASITTWVDDIDRDRGYSTTQERAKARAQAPGPAELGKN